MVAVRDFVVAADGEVGAVRGAEVAQREASRRRVTREARVAPAHERIAREDDVAGLAADHRLVTREVVHVAGDPFHGVLGQSGVAGHGWRSEYPCTAVSGWPEPFFRVAHQLEP